VKTPICILSFCCTSRSNGKTQPCYWLATNYTRRQQKREKHDRINKTHRKGQQRRTKTKWAYKKLPTQDYIQNTPNAEIPKRNFSLLSNPLVLFNRIIRG
jgi:hypothetical protein